MRIKHKKTIIICALIICLGVLELSGAIPYIVARAASSIYTAKHYPTAELTFAYTDGSKNPVFENTYSVVYEDKNGNPHSIVMYPKLFPIYMLFDSMKGQS